MAMEAKNVTFDPANMYSSKKKAKVQEKEAIIKLVFSQAPAGTVRATVINGWHTSPSDGRVHCTADYYDDAGDVIRREHIVEED
ncbi:hypothetical protein N7509_014032 [Penicillium cosmopolitanum]|uniref:Uncharacterized protein n=1 Tax=Penicillium cosmopolitanum TaxID=1131564 RepID=A0A9W9S160_9EURO|nr:uncharacterized protein N7509_014032 [Penicillium cosmopolitanum]KAJ5369420.1 hypothetical protein N7509_014032 [Penicillium cosmopolitanum]